MFSIFKKHAYPILKKYGFHAAAFVVTSWLHDEPKEFNPDQSVTLTKSDLEEMTDVFQYANHTNDFHQRTDEKTSMMMATSDEEFSKDLDKCNEYVQVKDVFAFPFGLYNERNVNLLKEKGFTLAFTTTTGKNDQQDTSLFYLKRNAIPYFVELDAFKRIVG